MKKSTYKNLIKVLNGIKFEILAISASIILAVFTFERVVYADIKDVIAGLQLVSGAVFTIVGLWIGFLYPNAISSIPKNDTGEGSESSAIEAIVKEDADFISSIDDAKRIEKLIYIIIYSALVMLMTLLFMLFKMILPTFLFYTSYHSFFKIIAISIIIYACWLQSKGILQIVFSNFRFVNMLYVKIAKAKLDNGGS